MSTASSTISATEISTDFERSTQAEDAADQGAVRNNGDEKISPFLGEGTEYSSSVPLEHLLNCVPNVTISTEANGSGKIVLHCDQSAEPNTSLAPTQFSPDLSVSKVQQSDLTTLLLPPGSSTSTGPSGVLQDQLHQFSREVVDLLKHQPHCQIALSKFIPTYHHHFGKQCRVADYGYSKLHELISALPNVVHVLGSGNTRILTLSHRVQVRRFTNEVIKILKSQSTKSCKVTDYPNLYKRIYRKDFHITDYGVCYLMDMLMEISDNTIEISQSGSDCVISLPKRVQTAEEKERTELFGIEVADLLRQSPRCRLQFNKFIPSYHHHFSRQCRVADYGFTKLIDLLEAVPNVVRIIEDHGEKYVVLARSRHLRIVGEQLLSMLESASNKRIGLEDLSGAYLKAQGYHLCPEDFGFNSLRELLASLPRIVRIEKVPVAVSETTPNDSSGIRGSGEAVDPKLMSEVMDNEDRIVTEKTETSVQEYVCLADRAQVKHLCHKTLLILLETPNGMLPTAAFTEQFRCTFKTEPDLLLIRNELDDVVEFRNSPNPMKENSTASSTISSNTTVLPEEQNVIKEQTGCLNESVIGDGSAEPSDRTDPTTFGKYICLQPLILFARELRDLLRQNQGKILLVQLCAAYQRRFGVPLSPQRYNHLSLATLIQSVDFVAVTRGRGVRCTLVVCQDFLGKLSHRVAYNTKPVLGSETVYSKSGKSCETMNSTVNENTTEKIPIPVRVEPQPKASWASTHASSSSVPGVTPLLSRTYQTSDFGDKATTMSLPYNYYSVPVSTHPPISMVSSNSDYTNVIAPSYSYYDYASQTIRQSDGSFGPILYPSPPQTTGYGPLTVITNTTAHQPMSHDFLRNGEQSTTGSIQYSRPMYPSPYSMPFTLNYTTGYSPIGSQIPGAPPILSTPGAQQLTTTSNPTFPCNVNSFGAWSPASSSTPLYLNRCTSKGQQQLDEFVEKLAYGGMQYDMGLISGPETSHLMTQQQSTSNHQEQPSDISTNTENDRRAIYCSSNEPRVHDGTQIPLAGLPPHPTQQGTGVACFPNRLSAEKLPNFSCNAETFAQLVNRRVTSDISKMELNGGEMVTKPPGLVASHVLSMPSYFQHESLGDLTSNSHFLTNKPVESITNLRDSSISLSSALTQMYPPNTINMPPNAEHHSSCAKDPNGRQLSSVTNEEAGTSQQSGNTEQQAQFYPSERNLFTSAGEDRCERSASKSDGRYDQGRSFSAEESSTGFCLDGLLAELRLEENQQKQQMRQQEMQHQQEQQRSHWSTMLSATNLEHALPMVPNQFAYF